MFESGWKVDNPYFDTNGSFFIAMVLFGIISMV